MDTEREVWAKTEQVQQAVEAGDVTTAEKRLDELRDTMEAAAVDWEIFPELVTHIDGLRKLLEMARKHPDSQGVLDEANFESRVNRLVTRIDLLYLRTVDEIDEPEPSAGPPKTERELYRRKFARYAQDKEERMGEMDELSELTIRMHAELEDLVEGPAGDLEDIRESREEMIKHAKDIIGDDWEPPIPEEHRLSDSDE